MIAIIALLMSILLPSLGTARRSAQSTINASNLRQLSIAMYQYTTDNQAYPALRLPRGQFNEATGRPRARWHFALGEYVGQPYTPRGASEVAAFIGSETMSASDDLPRLDNDVFRDPTHTIDDFVSSRTGNVMTLRNGSYGLNYQYLGNSRSEGPGGSPANWPVREATIRMPSMTVGIADSRGNQSQVLRTGHREHAYTLDAPRLDTERTNALSFAQDLEPSPADARHRGQANVAWVDGHATRNTLQELGYVVQEEGEGQRARGQFVAVDRGNNALWNGRGYDEDATDENEDG